MQSARTALGRASAIILFALLSAAAGLAIEKPRIRVDDYVINAEVAPATHHLSADARVSFTALEDVNAVVFELHNGLRISSVADDKGNKLSVERFSEDSAARISLPETLPKDSKDTLVFHYEGELNSADDSPVEGLKLAYISPDESYLLYAGRWFPVSGYGINRFTAKINIAVPAGYTVVGSGKTSGGSFSSTAASEEGPPKLERRKGESKAAYEKRVAASGATSSQKVSASGKDVYSFSWENPSFPGTIIIGHFVQASSGPIHVFFTPLHQKNMQQYAETANKEFEFFSGYYGPAPSATLNVVELPEDTVPLAWAPEVAAITARAISSKIDYRLLANTIAHQWWGVSMSPVTPDDRWLTEGSARYAEARYVENAAGEAGYKEAMKDIDVGALAYNNVPLASLGKLDPFSPEAQSLATDKGAAVMSMLRWVLGDAAYNKTMRQFAFLYAGKPVGAEDFEKVAEQNFGDKLAWFFTQWLNSTGAPEFTNKYTVYRLGNGKGFRVSGEIKQDLDLFRMPVQLKIDTDGRPEQKTVDVTGTDSAYTVETYGEPRKITVDPNDRVLKNSPDLRLRVAILKGEQLVQQGDFAGALTQLHQALDINHDSSLAHYRIADVFFQQHNFQAAADEYRASINGDGQPGWTEVWSHLQLGKIFDLTSQRDRAINEYRQALESTDNTAGALDEARKYLASPYQEPRSTASR